MAMMASRGEAMRGRRMDSGLWSAPASPATGDGIPLCRLVVVVVGSWWSEEEERSGGGNRPLVAEWLRLWLWGR